MLHATPLAAIAYGGFGQFVGIHGGQGVVAPLAGQAMRTFQHPAVNRDPAARAGSGNYPEHHVKTLARAIGRLDSTKQLASLARRMVGSARPGDRPQAACHSAKWSWHS